MRLPTVVRWLFARTEPTHVYECSSCGTSVDDDAESCPTCDSENISVYQIR